MDKKQQFFIYERKEIGVLFLLGLTVAVFAFTLGVHLGKRVGSGKMVAESEKSAAPLPVINNSPSREEMGEPDKKDSVTTSQASADENLGQVLHDEVMKTGVKMDAARQVQLPEKTETKVAGATEDTAKEKETPPHAVLPYTLQVGSFSDLGEAKARIVGFEAAGLKPSIHTADLKTKGKWYRIYIGEFASIRDAEKAGKQFHAKNMIQSFIVAKRVSSR
jgi:septal ring-binding cell division protein DamX